MRVLKTSAVVTDRYWPAPALHLESTTMAVTDPIRSLSISRFASICRTFSSFRQTFRRL